MQASRWLALAAIVVLALGGVWLLLRGDDPGLPDRDGILTITMADYAFEHAAWTVTAGEPVTFRFVNDDAVTHHITMGRGYAEVGRRPVAFATDLLDQVDVTVRPAGARVELQPPYAGVTIEVRGGATVDVTATFTDDQVGSWQIGCFTGRGCHLQAGLNGALTIAAAR